jgi:hypothetical protein
MRREIKNRHRRTRPRVFRESERVKTWLFITLTLYTTRSLRVLVRQATGKEELNETRRAAMHSTSGGIWEDQALEKHRTPLPRECLTARPKIASRWPRGSDRREKDLSRIGRRRVANTRSGSAATPDKVDEGAALRHRSDRATMKKTRAACIPRSVPDDPVVHPGAVETSLTHAP